MGRWTFQCSTVSNFQDNFGYCLYCYNFDCMLIDVPSVSGCLVVLDSFQVVQSEDVDNYLI